MRALGNLSRFVNYTCLSGSRDKPMDHMRLSINTNSNEESTSSNYMKGSHGNASNSFRTRSLEDSCWLDRMVQAFISCVTTGNVKVSYPLLLHSWNHLSSRTWEVLIFSISIPLGNLSDCFSYRFSGMFVMRWATYF